MAEGGIIYEKTIDPSIQDGSDKNLIINPNYAYQKKFSFGDDWTEIFLGLYLSYTNSVTDNNAAFSSGDNKYSGTASADSYSWLGVIKEETPRVLPYDASFIGMRFNKFKNVISSENQNFYNLLSDTSGYNDNVPFHIVTWNGSLIAGYSGETSTSSNQEHIFLPFPTMEETTLFCSYFGMRIKINNKGSTNQTINYKVYRQSSSSLWENNRTSNVSLEALKTKINQNSYYSVNETFTGDDISDNPIPIPDSFFFYNAFLDVRPRIHAVAVKKIS